MPSGAHTPLKPESSQQQFDTSIPRSSASTSLSVSSSLITRYHKIGILVLFVHDVADICLEFTKCNVYMKNRGGKYYPSHDHIATVGFLIFAVIW